MIVKHTSEAYQFLFHAEVSSYISLSAVVVDRHTDGQYVWVVYDWLLCSRVRIVQPWINTQLPASLYWVNICRQIAFMWFVVVSAAQNNSLRLSQCVCSKASVVAAAVAVVRACEIV